MAENAIVKSNKRSRTEEARQRRANEKFIRKAYREHGSTQGHKLEARRRELTVGIKAFEAFLVEIRQLLRSGKELSPEEYKEITLRKMEFELTAQYLNIEAQAQIIDNLSARFAARGKKTKKEGYVRWPASLFWDQILGELIRLRFAMESIAELPDSPDEDMETDPIEVEDDEIEADHDKGK